MTRAVLLTLLVSWWSFAADLSGTTWGIPQVSWDPTGAFVFDSIEDSVTRYDVRTGQTSTVEDAATSFIALSASRSSPDGKAMAEVKLNVPTETEGNWKGATFTPPKSGNHQLVIQRGGRSFVTGQADSIDTLSVYWSPDGRYVAWVVSPSRFHGMDGSSLVTASVGAAGPQVQVLGMPEVLKVATSKVTAAVEKQGAMVVFVGRAKKARATSVVYAAAGSEREAQAIAKALPGGGTVEALTWAAGVELVVALGASAGGAK
jgi:hypothetical protein